MKTENTPSGSYRYTDIVKYTVRYVIFWMLVFAASRAIFITYFWQRMSLAGWKNILESFISSWKLDLSTASYIFVFPWLILLLQSAIGWRGWDKIKTYYTGLILFIYSAVVFSELPVYQEWDTKLNYKALHYLSHPNEVLDNAGWKRLLLGLIAIVAFALFFLWVYKRYVHKPFIHLKREWGFTIDWIPMLVLIIIGIRGGIQQIPIQSTEVYFCSNNDVNTAAVNSLWNVMASVQMNYAVQFHNPYNYTDFRKAQEHVQALDAVAHDTTISVLTTMHPNIVFVILESWTAQCIKSFGGQGAATPEVDALTHDGLSFTQCYASGDRSDQGMAAILSGFPAQPLTSIINQPDKYQKLPCLLTPFKKEGYSSMFLFGGQLIYGNIKGYIYYNHFDKILEGKDFYNTYPSGQLGVSDQYMFDDYSKRISTLKQPFFSGYFTLSTHNPYDMPWHNKLTWGGEEVKYVNSMYYTDSCIGDFIRKCQKQPWYKNTLFVFVSDHSHNTPFTDDDKDAAHHWIFCMLYGDVIKPAYRGVKINDVFAQTDIAATLLAQAGLPYKDFPWSKNYFNPYSKRIAYSAIDNGFIWYNPFGNISYDIGSGKIIRDHFNNNAAKRDSALYDGKAYLQVLFQQYIDY